MKASFWISKNTVEHKPWDECCKHVRFIVPLMALEEKGTLFNLRVLQF